MAGRLSDDDANNMLDTRFGGVAVAVPATYYIGLSTTQPTNTGTNVTEPVGGGYARVAVTNDATNWPPAASRLKSNGVAITFPASTASWGTPLYFVIYDAAAAGNFRAYGPLASPQPIASGVTPSFPAGSLSITAPGF